MNRLSTINMFAIAMLCLSAICLAAHASAATPASELQIAVGDLRHYAGPHAASDLRYLSLYAIEPSQRREAAAVVSFVLNSVSRSRAIVRPTEVAGSDGRLLRFSLADYALPPETWEALASEDPYWHLQTQVLDPRTAKAKTVFTDGGWLDLALAAELRTLTHSGGALLRADHFIARAATTSRGGHYYRLAGVPEREADFYRQLGVDIKTIDVLSADAGANMIRSGVTLKLRRVARRPGPLGGAWITYDVEQNTAERDPLRNPFAFRFDASEHIAAKANGLQLFALYNAAGLRQESVPDRIAKDSSDVTGDGIIVPLLSCVRCHVEDGLRPVVNDQQRLLARHVDLHTERAADAERLADFYGADLEKLRVRDGDDYAAAVAKATDGLRPGQISAALGQIYRRYVDDLVTPEQACRELGIARARLVPLCAASDDPVLLSLCAGLAVQRQQWEAAFAQAALLTTQPAIHPGEKP
jgi:hypothetical protein